MGSGIKCMAVALTALTLAFVVNMAVADGLDYRQAGPQNQNEQGAPGNGNDPNAFFNNYRDKVQDLLTRDKLDPATGQVVPTQILRAPDTKEIPASQSPAATRAGKALTTPPAVIPCSRESAKGIGGGCLEGATGSLEDVKKRLEDLAAKDPAHAQGYRQSIANLDKLAQGSRTAKANKMTLIAAPSDGDEVARAYSKVEGFWKQRQKDWDVEAYVVCRGPAEALRFVKENRQQLFRNYGGGLPFPLQVVNEGASPKDVDLRRLPAVVLQGGKNREVVYDMDNLAQAWEDLHPIGNAKN
jgi:hypothetical protein